MLFLLDRRRFGEKSAFPPRAPHLARALRAATTPRPPSPPSQSTWLPTSLRRRAARRPPPTCVPSPAAIASRVAMRFRPPRRCVDRLVGGPIGASLGDAARANAPPEPSGRPRTARLIASRAFRPRESRIAGRFIPPRASRRRRLSCRNRPTPRQPPPEVADCRSRKIDPPRPWLAPPLTHPPSLPLSPRARRLR